MRKRICSPLALSFYTTTLYIILIYNWVPDILRLKAISLLSQGVLLASLNMSCTGVLASLFYLLYAMVAPSSWVVSIPIAAALAAAVKKNNKVLAAVAAGLLVSLSLPGLLIQYSNVYAVISASILLISFSHAFSTVKWVKNMADKLLLAAGLVLNVFSLILLLLWLLHEVPLDLPYLMASVAFYSSAAGFLTPMHSASNAQR